MRHDANVGEAVLAAARSQQIDREKRRTSVLLA